MPKKINIGPCKADNCNNPERSLGYCNNHYSLFKKYGTPEKLVRNKRNHKYYSLWFERKSNNLLSERWLNFSNFVEDIGDRPEGNYFLERIDKNRLFDKDNFLWKSFLKKRDDESQTEWNARKWASRYKENSNSEINRSLRRIYGLLPEQYDDLLKKQNGVCAICKNQESLISNDTGLLKNLAVDHCHKTNMIRGLLCFKCNTVLGRLGDSLDSIRKRIDILYKRIDRMKEMEKYLSKEPIIIDKIIPHSLKKKNYIETPEGIMDVEQASNHYGIAVRTLNRRILKGLPVEEILKAPKPRKKPTTL